MQVKDSATSDQIKDDASYLKKVLDWLPDSMMNCKSNDTFKSAEAKEWRKKHCFAFTCNTEIVRLIDCAYLWCTFPAKSSMRFNGLVSHPVMMKNEK